MVSANAFAPVAITSRNDFDESIHFGAVVGLGPSGSIEYAIGDPDIKIYPRSANKPMQAVAMLRAGLQLPADLLAIACASHDGTSMHRDAVQRILAGCGLTDESLANTPSMPLDLEAANEMIRAGKPPTSLAMNCSGKHSAMLATCVHNGWVHDRSYLSVDHPLQTLITSTIDDLVGERHAHIGVDGCGAPAHAMSLIGVARAFRSIANGSAGTEGDQVYAAMTKHPEMVEGFTGLVTRFMQHVPGIMAKDGAEGVFAAASMSVNMVSISEMWMRTSERSCSTVATLRALSGEGPARGFRMDRCRM